MGAFHLLCIAKDNEEHQKVLRSMLSKYPGRSRLDVDIMGRGHHVRSAYGLG